jgi:PAB1-binding protein PBP1
MRKTLAISAVFATILLLVALPANAARMSGKVGVPELGPWPSPNPWEDPVALGPWPSPNPWEDPVALGPWPSPNPWEDPVALG